MVPAGQYPARACLGHCLSQGQTFGTLHGARQARDKRGASAGQARRQAIRRGGEEKVKGPIVIAMSGGVDSSVAAGLISEDARRSPGGDANASGPPVQGAMLKVWDNARGCPDPKRSKKVNACCSVEDVNDALRVATKLGIPFHVVDSRGDFDRAVLDPAVAAYARGRTPNPCVDCNRYLKFGSLLDWAQERGVDHLATGHYARIARDETGRHVLRRGVDPGKDQSYFLFFLGEEALSRLIFPLGDMTKDEVRRHARRLGLEVAHKAESQDLCVPLAREERPGEIVTREGRVIGRHPGVSFFTIGQRRGLGLGGGTPLFVIRLDAERRQVVVGSQADLLASGLTATLDGWNAPRPEGWIHVAVQHRYRSPAAPAQVRLRGAQLEVRFDEPQRALAPGQAAVVYDGDRVLGGGWIDASVPVESHDIEAD